jgi:hypothetical protein
MPQWDIFGHGTKRSSNRRRAIELFDGLRAVQTTTSGTYATCTNATKAITWPGGMAIIFLDISHYVSSAVDTEVEYQFIRTDTSAVLAGGAIWSHWFRVADQEQFASFHALVELPRGSYTVALQWRRGSGSGTIESDFQTINMATILPVF